MYFKQELIINRSVQLPITAIDTALSGMICLKNSSLHSYDSLYHTKNCVQVIKFYF